MKNTQNSGMVIVHGGYVGTKKRCTNCGKCGKEKEQQNVECLEPEPLYPGGIAINEEDKDKVDDQEFEPLYPAGVEEEEEDEETDDEEDEN